VIPGNAPHAFLDDLVVIHDTSLPSILGLANTDAALEVVDDRAQVVDQADFLGVDSLDDTMEADMMLWSLRQRCERTRIRTDLPSQSCDTVNAWHLPVT
jgi:hypothetical protein